MYSMPIVGTSARLYFSNEMCVEPIVTGCVRTNGSSCEQFSDTSNRYFVTESDNHLDMLPGAVNFSRPGLSVNLNDDDGISHRVPVIIIDNLTKNNKVENKS